MPCYREPIAVVVESLESALAVDVHAVIVDDGVARAARDADRIRVHELGRKLSHP